MKLIPWQYPSLELSQDTFVVVVAVAVVAWKLSEFRLKISDYSKLLPIHVHHRGQRLIPRMLDEPKGSRF